MTAMRVLIVEDDPKIAAALAEGLAGERMDAVVERSGDAGLRRASTGAFDAVILDLTLPGLSGLQLLHEVRRGGVTTPIVVTSACDAVDDRVRCLDGGADDYLVKPYAFSELVARLRAVTRSRTVSRMLLHVDGLDVDVAARRVTLDGATLELTAREFDLLVYLMRRAGQVVSRESLASDVWREHGRSPSFDNIVDVYVARLRRKIDPGGVLLQTVRGVGFKFARVDVDQ